jgi:hypothetical protein
MAIVHLDQSPGELKTQNHLHFGWFMVFNTIFNNISVLLVEETGVPGENHQPVASH